MKRMSIIAAIIVAAIVVIWLLLPSKSNDTSNNSASTQQLAEIVIKDADLVIGNRTPKATVIEYADFKCPTCNQFHQTTGNELRGNDIEKGDMSILFRPMAVIGPDSERAAVGAYCAHEQSKFVEYHDAVYDYMWENYYRDRNYKAEFEDVLTSGVLTSLASKVGVESLSFTSCLNDTGKQQFVAQNQQLATKAGVRGTPTFSVNDKLVVGSQSASVFRNLVKAR